ncbi:MAG: hypothetical protein NTZ73_00130 [Candidatus Diapherotrites archaeon]|nr:hypothetical protein [Candidatus Diapherotrites archaeon]
MLYLLSYSGTAAQSAGTWAASSLAFDAACLALLGIFVAPADSI